MEIKEIDLKQLRGAPWNPNHMEPSDFARLKKSLQTYGLVQNLVVRPLGNDQYEVLSGNQRLNILKELHISPVLCVVAKLDDIQSRLLAQALNHIHGEDDLGMRAEVLREVLKTVSEAEVLALLPETKGNLTALSTMSQNSIADSLQNWQQAQSAKLKHCQFQLTSKQTDTVEKALTQILPDAKQENNDNPNIRGNALYLLCKFYLEKRKDEEKDR
ncbi:MAG: ParB N-terminal domain-containing protein [Dehalococcoidales bacterium]